MASENKIEQENVFKNKVVVLGLTAAISAYKICFLINKLKKASAQIRLIATENALNFITKTTLQTLAKTPVLTEQFDLKKYDINHKSLQAEADLFILAPASANTIAKIATGVADNLLASVLCAWQKPLIIAPAMNGGMWHNPATQKNIKILQTRGAIIIGPQEAQTSDGTIARGPLASIANIFDAAKNILTLQGKLKGKKVLILGGAIRENIDEKTFISVNNTACVDGGGDVFSSVDNAVFPADFIMAQIAFVSGAQVLLITDTPCSAPYIQLKAQNCAEYKAATLKNIDKTDILIYALKAPTWQISARSQNGAELNLQLKSAQDFFKEIFPQEPAGLTILDLRKYESFAQGFDFACARDILFNKK